MRADELVKPRMWKPLPHYLPKLRAYDPDTSTPEANLRDSMGDLCEKSHRNNGNHNEDLEIAQQIISTNAGK